MLYCGSCSGSCSVAVVARQLCGSCSVAVVVTCSGSCSVAHVYSSPILVCASTGCVLIISRGRFRFLGVCVCVCLSPRAVCEHEVQMLQWCGGTVGWTGSCAWLDPRNISAVAKKIRHNQCSSSSSSSSSCCRCCQWCGGAVVARRLCLA